MPEEGLEPSRHQLAPDFESGASANSATPAGTRHYPYCGCVGQCIPACPLIHQNRLPSTKKDNERDFVGPLNASLFSFTASQKHKNSPCGDPCSVTLYAAGIPI